MLLNTLMMPDTFMNKVLYMPLFIQTIKKAITSNEVTASFKYIGHTLMYLLFSKINDYGE